jgi:hypothetical protein
VTSCDNPADSALNQYCQTIPAAGGGQRPEVGTRAVAPALPPAIVHELSGPAASAKARRTRRALLRLPAPVRRESVTAGHPTLASTQSLSTWVIVIAALMALALLGGTLAERRRRSAS